MSYSFSGDIEEEGQSRFALVIFLPDELERMIAPLRERFDPDCNLIPAHVTLVFPFVSTRSIDDLSKVIRSETDRLGPLQIELNSIADFYPDCPIIYWRVKQSDTLNRLYRLFHARIDLPLPYKEFLPHVTVAREISADRVVLVKDEIAAYLPDETFETASIDLVSPVANHHWVSVETFPLIGF